MTIDTTPEIVGISDDFPIEFDDPSDAEIEWEWDDMHMPFPVAPLSGDWAIAIGRAFDSWKSGLGIDYPSRGYGRVWNGYVYYGFRTNYPAEEKDAWRAKATEFWRSRIAVTDSYWNDEVLPELRDMYATLRSADVEAGTREVVAEAWEAAWRAAQRAWDLHFVAILGPYQVLDDLADLYEALVPDAPAGEAMRLVQGTRHELYESEVGIERLAAQAAGSPALSSALRSGVRSLDALRELPDGPAFVDAFRAFLDEHGHLGQSVDDLALASWLEEPGHLLAELAKRLDHAPEPAEERRARLEREAFELADRARAGLADRPDERVRLDALIEMARRIGPLTEVHNYWIDRAAQAHVRSLAMRIGKRLVAEGALAQPDDVLYLHAEEIAPLLRAPDDRRELIAGRRDLHQRQRSMKAPKFVGKPPEERGPDRFEGSRIESTEPGVLRGTGASPGVVRGPARVVHNSTEFDRIMPGDVIVCASTNPSWVPVFTIAGGLVTNTGGVISHAAVVAREFGLPAVVGVTGATTDIEDGRLVEIDGTQGTVRLL
jgi:pyruvate,water dikinase